MPNNAHRLRSSKGGFRLYGGDARGIYGSPSRGTMIYGKRPRPRWPFVVAALVVVAIVAVFFIVRAVAAGNERAAEEQAAQEAAQQAATQEPAKETASGPSGTVKISAVGDLTFGTDENFDRSTSFNATFEENGASYFLSGVLPFLSADQLTIGNFEGTLTQATAREDKTFAFKGDASYAQALVDGSVEAVNLANNHSYDYGEQSYTDTIAALDAVGVKNFGYERTAVYEVGEIKVGLLGVNALSGDIEATEKQLVQDVTQLDEAGCHIIIASAHWGIEGDHEATADQTTLAHAAIDAGCDLVLGTHPHVIQGIEKYKDRYICYSLGNFCFGGNRNPGEYDTMIFQQTFTVENGELVVDDATLRQMDVVPCSVSSAQGYNDYCPTPQTGDAGAEVLASLNGYSSMLGSGAVLVDAQVGQAGTAAVTADSAKSTGSVSAASVEAARLNAGVASASASANASDSVSADTASAAGASSSSASTGTSSATQAADTASSAAGN